MEPSRKLPVANPGRKRNLALLVLFLSVAAVVVAFRMPDGGQGFTLQTVLGIGGGTIVPFALVSALLCHSAERRFARMRRGEGVLARWTIEPAQWQAFVEQSRKLDRKGESAPNCLSLRGAPSGGGVEVIVSDNALYVGGEFHALDKDIRVAVHPCYVEMHQTIHDPNGPNVRILFRFPIPGGAQAEAERIRRHYAAAYAAAAADPRGKLYVALGFAAFILVFVVWGIYSEVIARR